MTDLATALQRVKHLQALFNLPVGCQIVQAAIGAPVAIVCENRQVFHQLKRQVVALATAAQLVDAPEVILHCPQIVAPLKFKPEPILHYWGANMDDSTLPRAGDGLIIIRHRLEMDRLIFLSPNTNIIDMATDTGILAGANCHKTSGLTPEQWIGRKMSEQTPKGVNTWIPSEKAKFIDALLQHPDGVNGYEYPAFNYHGDPIWQCVKAQICHLWDGRIVRIVESLNT